MMQLRLFHILFFAAVLNAVFRPALQDFKVGGFEELLAGGFGANYIIWFAIWVGLISLRLTKKPYPKMFIAPILVLCLIPSASLAWIAAAIAAFGLVSVAKDKMPALLLIATCLREPITAFCLKLLSGNILAFDAVLANLALQVMGQEPAVSENILVTQSGQPLLVLTGCSVFTNLSFVSLLWMSLIVLAGSKITKGSFVLLIAIVLVTLATNAFRLALMTESK
ncbi:MAG: hypothetical protein R3261_15320, partial [Alphaproteobacteria bacterium]|nr:hypothetical protein [Alphaproteobacteria bacterium]